MLIRGKLGDVNREKKTYVYDDWIIKHDTKVGC